MSDEELFEKGYNRVYDTLEMEANLNYVEEFSARALDDAAGRALERDHLPRPGQGAGRRPQGRGRPAQRLPQGGAGLRPRLHGLGAGPRPLHLGHEEGAGSGITEAEALFATLPRYNPLPRPQQLRALRPGLEAPRHLHRSAAACRGTGRRRSGPTSTSSTTAWASTSSRRATSTRCASAPSPRTGAGSPGCTYSEGVSWGKFVPESEGGRFAEVYADATTVWPLLIKGVLEEMKGKPAPPAAGAKRGGPDRERAGPLRPAPPSARRTPVSGGMASRYDAIVIGGRPQRPGQRGLPRARRARRCWSWSAATWWEAPR